MTQHNASEIGIEKLQFLTYRNEDIHIAFAIDTRYVQHMGVAMTSIVVNNPNVNFHFHVLYDSIGETDFSRMQHLSLLYQVPVYLYKIVDAPLFDNLPTIFHLSKAVYYRLLLPYLLPQQLPKVLYLDADVVCVGDIMKLWRIPLESSALAAKNIQAEPDQIARLGLKSGQYFNDGAMLMNLPIWRQKQLTVRVIEFVAKYPERIILLEQDALSAILDGQFARMDGAVHTLIDCATGSGHITEDSVIVHFAGMCKPWQQWCPDLRKSIYWQYLQMSPWFDARPDEPTTPYQALVAARLENDKGNMAAVRHILELLMQRIVIPQ